MMLCLRLILLCFLCLVALGACHRSSTSSSNENATSKSYAGDIDTLRSSNLGIQQTCRSAHYREKALELRECTQNGIDLTSDALFKVQTALDHACARLELVDPSPAHPLDVIEHYGSVLSELTIAMVKAIISINYVLEHSAVLCHRCYKHVTDLHIQLLRVIQAYLQEISNSPSMREFFVNHPMIHQHNWDELLRVLVRG